jgi:hypothetical protein
MAHEKVEDIRLSVDSTGQYPAIVGVVTQWGTSRSIRLLDLALTLVPCLHEIRIDDRRAPEQHIRVIFGLDH